MNRHEFLKTLPSMLTDAGETINVAEKYPETVEKMESLLKQIRRQGDRSMKH